MSMREFAMSIGVVSKGAFSLSDLSDKPHKHYERPGRCTTPTGFWDLKFLDE